MTISTPMTWAMSKDQESPSLYIDFGEGRVMIGTFVAPDCAGVGLADAGGPNPVGALVHLREPQYAPIYLGFKNSASLDVLLLHLAEVRAALVERENS